MENKNPPNQITDEGKKRALLVEYQACQHDNNSTSLSYWTLSGIFLGFTAVLLGGLIYGVVSNEYLMQILLNPEPQHKVFLVLGIIVYILSMAVLIILHFLKGWLTRVQFLAKVNFERMREIELELGMFKSLRVHSIDNWDKLEEAESIRVKDYYGKKWRDKMRKSPIYEPPSSRLHYPGIFYSLLGLWALVLLGSFYLLCVHSCIAIGTTIGIIILICLVIFLYKKRLNKQSESC